MLTWYDCSLVCCWRHRVGFKYHENIPRIVWLCNPLAFPDEFCRDLSHTFKNMKVLIELPFEGSVQNSWVLEVDPEKVRRKLPVLITTRLDRSSRQVWVLSSNGVTIAHDVVGGNIIDDPRNNRLQLSIWLVETCNAVRESIRDRECVDVDVRSVVSKNGGPDVE